MPVHSKILTGRKKKPPPIPGPKPILKKSIHAWESPTHSNLGFQANTPASPLTPSSPSLHVAVLRSPMSNGPLSPSVTYLPDAHQAIAKDWTIAAENVATVPVMQNGDDGWSSSEEEVSQKSAVGGIISKSDEHGGRRSGLMLRQLSGVDALRECEVSLNCTNNETVCCQLLSVQKTGTYLFTKRHIFDKSKLKALSENKIRMGGGGG